MKLDLKAIRIEMARKDINQKELAEISGLRRATICNVMCGKSNGSIKTWGKIAKALDIPVAELIKE